MLVLPLAIHIPVDEGEWFLSKEHLKTFGGKDSLISPLASLCGSHIGRNVRFSQILQYEKTPDPKIEGFRVFYMLNFRSSLPFTMSRKKINNDQQRIY